MVENYMADTSKRKLQLGEILVKHGLISSNQLKDALNRQGQVGGQIGSILVEMGLITTDDLLNFLSKQLGVPSFNLLKVDVAPEVLKLLPRDRIMAMKVLPIGVDENTVTLAMVNPNDMISIRDIEFLLGKNVKPVVVPSLQMEAAIRSILLHPDNRLTGESIEMEALKTESKKAPALILLLRYLASSNATDMLLTAGVPPSIKFSNDIKRASMDALTPSVCEEYAKEIMSENAWKVFLNKGDYDLAV